MADSIAAIRKEYSKESMDANDLAVNPIEQFKKWFDQALKSEVIEANAMNIATSNGQGGVSSRVVLLKDIDNDGIVFYTNYESEKGKQIAANSKVAITFFWPELERQVRMEGKAEKVSEERSSEYFHSRPRSSQIGAWVSPQSDHIVSRAFIEDRQVAFEKKFEGIEIPKPVHWGGYKVTLNIVEFWQGRPSRLHDRFRYMLQNNAWKMDRLAP